MSLKLKSELASTVGTGAEDTTKEQKDMLKVGVEVTRSEA